MPPPATPADAGRNLAEARRAWLADDWAAAAALLERIVPASRAQRVEVALLQARVRLRAERPDRVLVVLDAAVAEMEGDEEHATAAMLRGTALAALGRLEDGIVLLEQAATSASGAQRDEAVYELAAALRRAGRLHQAEAVLAPLVDAERGEHAPYVIVRALAMYGQIEAQRKRRPMAARHFLDALAMLRRTPAACAPLRLALIHGLVSIAIETLDPRLFARVRREAASLPRTAGSEWFELQQFRVVGELLCGNVDGGWTIAFELSHQASAGAEYVSAVLLAATVARVAGETFTPTRLALIAADVSRHVDWADLGASGRRTLLTAIRETAPVSPAAATALLASYDARPPRSDRDEQEDDSGGEGAWEQLARASVSGAHGWRPDQLRALRSALALARNGGDHCAEVYALLALLQVEPDDDSLRRAEELTRVVPQSWLRRRYESVAERASGPDRLSPAERRVMTAICEGRSNAQIAQAFGRSTNTIRNQARRVYEIMGVRTRSALVARCAAMRL